MRASNDKKELTQRQRWIVINFTDHRYHLRKTTPQMLEQVWLHRDDKSPKKAARAIGIGNTLFGYWRRKMGGKPLR